MHRLDKIKTRLARAGNTSGAAYLFWYEHRRMCLALICLAACVFLCCIAIDRAHADFLSDLFGIDKIVDGMIDASIKPANDLLKNLIGESNLLNSFADVFGSGREGYNLIKNIKEVTINPIGYTLLAIIFLIQTAKLAGKFDANGTMPAFKEVIFMFIYFVLFKYLLDISFELCVGIFDWTKDIISGVFSFSTTGSVDQDYVLADMFSGGTFIIIILEMIVIYLTALVACAVGYFSVFARSLQIYLYTALAPIPLSMLGLDETRQYGMGFLKNYLSVCLAGVIMAVTIVLFPVIMRFAQNTDIPGLALPAMLGAAIMFIAALLKSGSWARDILGG